MARVGNSIIKGVDIDEVIRLLNKAYADEWLAYYQYYIESKVIKGIMKENIILQLGGTPLLNPKEWFTHTNCGYDEPKDFDVLAILEDAIKGEQCAIKTYSELVDITKDKDIVTYDIVSQILADEVEHEEDLQAIYEDISEFVENIKGSIK